MQPCLWYMVFINFHKNYHYKKAEFQNVRYFPKIIGYCRCHNLWDCTAYFQASRHWQSTSLWKQWTPTIKENYFQNLLRTPGMNWYTCILVCRFFPRKSGPLQISVSYISTCNWTCLAQCVQPTYMYQYITCTRNLISISKCSKAVVTFLAF